MATLTKKELLEAIELKLKRLFCKCNKMLLIGYEKDKEGKITQSKWECVKCKKVYYQWEVDLY